MTRSDAHPASEHSASDHLPANHAPTHHAPWHLPTALALGAFAWMLLMTGHEVLGHGGACVALGAEALAVDAMYFTCSPLEPTWKDLLYRAAGSLFNVALAGVAVVWLGRLREPRSWLGYFLWTTAILNLLQSGSYVAFGRFIHPGMDWPMIVSRSPAPNLWAPAVLIFGLVLLVGGFWIGRTRMPLFLEPEGSGRRQAARLVLTPYLAASAVSIAASAFVPGEDRMMMIMGGIGNSLFFLAPMLLLILWPPATTRRLPGGPHLGARPVVVTACVVAVLLYVFVMAPGLG